MEDSQSEVGQQAETKKVLDFAKLREFAELTVRSKYIDDEQKQIKAKLEILEPVLLEQMADEGMQNVRLGGRTYYIRRDLFASPSEGHDKVGVIAALKEAELGDYVSETYNSSSLSAYVRSLKQEAENNESMTTNEIKALLPKPLQDVLRVGENYRLASRKG